MDRLSSGCPIARCSEDLQPAGEGSVAGPTHAGRQGESSDTAANSTNNTSC